MQGQLKPDLENPKSRVGPEHVVHDDHVGAVHHPDPDSGAGAHGKPVRVTDRSRAQLVQVEVRITKLEKSRTQLLLVGVPVLLHESVGLQGLQKAVHRRPGETEAVRQLAHPQAPRPAGESLEDRGRSIDRLDRSTATFFRIFIIRHC